MVDNHVACVHDGIISLALHGLWQAKGCKRAYFFTATTTPFHNRFYEVNFKVNSNSIATFQSSSQINDGVVHGSDNIEKLHTSTAEQTLKLISVQVKKIVSNTPVVILIEEMNDKIDTTLDALTKAKGIQYLVATDCVKAKDVKARIAKFNTGVVRIDREVSRGYDLKFAQDSFVIVVVNGTSMQMHELEQAISRGSRSQGIVKGVIIIQDK